MAADRTDYAFDLADDLRVRASGDPHSVIVDRFYAGYDRAFILPDEREDLAGFRQCLALNADHSGHSGRHHRELVMVLEDAAGTLLGGANFLVTAVAPRPGWPPATVALNYIYTERAARGRGLLRQMLAAVRRLALLAMDLPADGAAPVIFIEQNDPLRRSDSEVLLDTDHSGTNQIDRLAIWDRVGARIVDFPYVQPPLSPGQGADDRLVYAAIDHPGVALDPRLLHDHLQSFFAVSVRKGVPEAPGGVAAAQLATLAERQEPVMLLCMRPALARLRSIEMTGGSGEGATALRDLARDAVRGRHPDGAEYERALPGTVYWTLSLFVEREKVAAALGRSPGDCLQPEEFGRVQMGHGPSLALRNAMDPLMNDIADRETRGAVQEHLLATAAADPDDPYDAVDLAREYEELVFAPPASIAWSTEGTRFHAHPPFLDDERIVRMRCFWLSHNNGALSYHMSFTHHYGQALAPGSAHDPSTYYFLSMLQKLAAPKEYALDPPQSVRGGEADVHAEGPLGIDPLDGMAVRQHHGPAQRFWPFVRERFTRDACVLFDRIAATLGTESVLDDGLAHDLVDLVPFIEVPGLKVPRSRFMFMFHDERFFDRLMPVDDAGASIQRKVAVQEPCYDPYARRMAALIAPIDGKPPRAVHLGPSPNPGRPREHDAPDFWQLAADRPDCLDYLFLSGFNQNIIDFMNQDTSEILDSIDPIYPSSPEQEGERFFVRYANHRAMITYVRKSRSLEAGNDYIGTCPYAFLIHALALHNEFLARAHEDRTMDRIGAIHAAIDGQRTRQAERMINEVKLAEFEDYERYRYANPFRYDTEREVFGKLEELRGTSRKQAALSRAVASLEDHASDIELRAQRNRDLRLNILLGGTGVFGAGQMIYWVGEKAHGNGEQEPARSVNFFGVFLPKGPATGNLILGTTEFLMFVALFLFAGALVAIALSWVTQLTRDRRAGEYRKAGRSGKNRSTPRDG